MIGYDVKEYKKYTIKPLDIYGLWYPEKDAKTDWDYLRISF